MELAGLIAVIAIALVFTYTIGFHDAANAIATSVSTRALTPRTALIMAAAMNLLGGLLVKFSGGVAATVGKDIIQLNEQSAFGLLVVFAALVGAIAWNLATWYVGLPSSSSHALIGGLVGAALAAAGLSDVLWGGVLTGFVIPALLSPLVGFLLAYFVMVAILWIFRKATPGRTGRGFRRAQTVSAAAMALGHGLQDAAKTMGVIVLALLTTGYLSDPPGAASFPIPFWVVFVTAGTLSLGTYSGGWRIMRTLGRRIIELDPPKGFAAESSASAVLFITAYVYEAPISTTHTITSSIMGVGATRRLSAVRWGVAGNILMAWFLTLPGAGIVAAVAFWIAQAVVGV